ncbi:N,N-dimethylformamidase beta subunit family domain-containing protein [Nocardioides sp.]|uniref:N,N-dimethylformamidase beta subunit family domain-containing protein n=1 Tax=Nocardioides sp. TaxID=35761 RepID=UPI002D7FD65F|nr:N,N-dimethylformamidase beta subunit family domain-containing protein [Nocardioides sp.]HET8960736.1 N,N-dimethylformamidase beta subunit family domain-containing protein [Nocardioides sp.]
MRTTTRPARPTGIVVAGLAVCLATGLVLTGCAATSPASMDRAAGAAGGKGPRSDDGGPGPVTASPSPVESDSGGPSAPAAPREAALAAARGAETGSEEWRARRPAAGRIAGYSTTASGPAGTRVGLKVSTSASRYRVIAYRLGAYDGGTGLEVWHSGLLEGREQAAPVMRPASTRTVVAPWRRDLTVDTDGWEPGFYVFKLRTGQGHEVLVPYVVSSPSAAGTVALVAPITTWQAYNEWGGYSLYDGPDADRRSWAVSFDRPYNGATGANDYRTAAVPIIVRAEQLGIPLSYYTNVDLHTTAGLLEGARGYVSMGHDEYWTTTMRSAVTEARDAGTNLAFFGANTMYWRVRLADAATGAARLVVGYRSDAGLDPEREERPREATARFRDAPMPNPEQELTGMMYECYPVDTDYVVASPGWWGFRGAGVTRGDRIPGLVGPEADRVYPTGSLPRPMQILSHSPYSCGGVSTAAESVYYTAPSGAGVFNAGTLRWGCAMVDRCERPLGARTARFVEVVTGNVLRGFAAGPAARRHPARDNVQEFDLSPHNAVSAS